MVKASWFTPAAGKKPPATKSNKASSEVEKSPSPVTRRKKNPANPEVVKQGATRREKVLAALHAGFVFCENFKKDKTSNPKEVLDLVLVQEWLDWRIDYLRRYKNATDAPLDQFFFLISRKKFVLPIDIQSLSQLIDMGREKLSFVVKFDMSDIRVKCLFEMLSAGIPKEDDAKT
jgi:hypothetical protein